jgi:hypothetical protein
MMTFRKICFTMLLGILLHCFTGCNAEKEVAERRNLMMPKKSEQPRNSSHFREPAKKKTYKKKARKKKKTKKLF